jgi:phosphotriesterase-related protein
MSGRYLYTTLGRLERDALGAILPHEHVFVDLRTPDQPGYAQADAADVVALMAPQAAAIQAQGVTALVECSTLGVGRRGDLDLAVSRATGLPIVVPTGSYREPWITPFIGSASDAGLEAFFVRELTERLDEADFRAGWIKISAGDDGFTALEERILRAAARASLATGALIGSHTIRGRVALEQLRVLASEGCPADRFLWIHTQVEPDFGLHREAVARGAWIEYDDVGRSPDAEVAPRIRRALDHGLGGRLLVSHDLGWYDPAQPGGGTPRPWTHLFGVLLARLAADGVPAATLSALTRDNPFAAFARP